MLRLLYELYLDIIDQVMSHIPKCHSASWHLWLQLMVYLCTPHNYTFRVKQSWRGSIYINSNIGHPLLRPRVEGVKTLWYQFTYTCALAANAFPIQTAFALSKISKNLDSLGLHVIINSQLALFQNRTNTIICGCF